MAASPMRRALEREGKGKGQLRFELAPPSFLPSFLSKKLRATHLVLVSASPDEEGDTEVARSANFLRTRR